MEWDYKRRTKKLMYVLPQIKSLELVSLEALIVCLHGEALLHHNVSARSFMILL